MFMQFLKQTFVFKTKIDFFKMKVFLTDVLDVLRI